MHIRTHVIVLATLVVVFPASRVAAQSPPLLTLAQAVDEALAANDRMLDQRDTMVHADLGVRLARSAFRPKITPNVLGSFGQTNVSSQTYRLDLSQRFVTGTELRLGVGTATAQIPGLSGDAADDIRFYNADTTLTLSQPLLRGFGRDVARRSLTTAELRRAEAERSRSLAEQQLAVEVAAAYYRVVASEAFVRVARLSVDRARYLRDASEAKLEAGLVSQLDVLRAQQLVAQAQSQLFDAQSSSEDARDQLLFLMGRQSREAFAVDAEIQPPDAPPIDADGATAIALANRVDLKSRLAAHDDADRRVSYARNQLLPQVDVNLAVTRRETSSTLARSFGLDGYRVATFFTIGMPVDRTAQQVEFQTAVLERDRLRRQTALAERQVGDDVRRAIRERERIARALLTAETSVEIGRKEVEVAQLRYERGLSNNLDVVAAESNLLTAESRRIQALAEAAASQLRLRAVLGVLDPRADASSLPGVRP